jgi:hypothetical protein
MQTCALCNATAADTALTCGHCGADLSCFSTRAVALRRLQANPRVRAVRISLAQDSCPACEELSGTYPKESVPALPHPACAHPHGCRCFYEPVLSDTAVLSTVAR